MSRSVLVTGGNRGIGLAVARAFAANGDRVTVAHRGGPTPEGLTGVRCDVTDPVAIRRAFAEVEATQGPVEVLVANAGITKDALLLRMKDQDFDDVIATNLTGSVRVAKQAALGMLERRWGRLIFISSVVAATGSPGQVNYAASKAAHVGIARSMAWELGSRGITVNVVAPGLIETDMAKTITAKRREQYLQMTPLGRAGRVEEVAQVVKFLASDDAAYVTGAIVPVSGGLGLGH